MCACAQAYTHIDRQNSTCWPHLLGCPIVCWQSHLHRRHMHQTNVQRLCESTLFSENVKVRSQLHSLKAVVQTWMGYSADDIPMLRNEAQQWYRKSRHYLTPIPIYTLQLNLFVNCASTQDFRDTLSPLNLPSVLRAGVIWTRLTWFTRLHYLAHNSRSKAAVLYALTCE